MKNKQGGEAPKTWVGRSPPKNITDELKKTQGGGPPNYHRRKEGTGRWTTQSPQNKGGNREVDHPIITEERREQGGGPPNHHRRKEGTGRWTTQSPQKKGGNREVDHPITIEGRNRKVNHPKIPWRKERKKQMGRWTTKTHQAEKDQVISVSSTNYPQTEKQRNIPILINYSDDNNSVLLI